MQPLVSSTPANTLRGHWSAVSESMSVRLWLRLKSRKIPGALGATKTSSKRLAKAITPVNWSPLPAMTVTLTMARPGRKVPCTGSSEHPGISAFRSMRPRWPVDEANWQTPFNRSFLNKAVLRDLRSHTSLAGANSPGVWDHHNCRVDVFSRARHTMSPRRSLRSGTPCTAMLLAARTLHT